MTTLYDASAVFQLDWLKGQKASIDGVARALRQDPHLLDAADLGFLVNTGKQLILVDAGAGTWYGGGAFGRLAGSLRSAGYTPEQVDLTYREQIRKDRAKRAARGKQDLEDWMCEEGLEDSRADLRTTQRPKGIPFYQSKTCDPRRLAKSEVSAATSDLFIDVQCTANKLRTPPLWGVRLRTRLMHDGQSVVMEDAILRHQGEAKRVTDKFKGLSPQDKAAVVAFLLSL